MTREEAIKTWLPIISMGIDNMPELKKAFDMAIKALEQEPFINKPCVSLEVCEHDKNKVLDKIRAEIEELDGRYVIGDYGTYGENTPKYVRLWDVLQIIDKYKAESEDKK